MGITLRSTANFRCAQYQPANSPRVRPCRIATGATLTPSGAMPQGLTAWPQPPEPLIAQAIAAVNPAVNAVVETYPDRIEGLDESTLGAGPFRGVPFLMKDVFGHEGGGVLRDFEDHYVGLNACGVEAYGFGQEAGVFVIGVHLLRGFFQGYQAGGG